MLADVIIDLISPNSKERSQNRNINIVDAAR